MTEYKYVSVFCHTCEGTGAIEDKSYPDGKIIMVLCPECRGNKYVNVESVESIE